MLSALHHITGPCNYTAAMPMTSHLPKQATWHLLSLLLYVSVHSGAELLELCAGFVDRNRRFPNSTWAFSSDGIGIIVGSAMGTSPVTAYIDSATGIREGARTGLAALTCTFLFFIALFFNPLFGASYIRSPTCGLLDSLPHAMCWHLTSVSQQAAACSPPAGRW